MKIIKNYWLNDELNEMINYYGILNGLVFQLVCKKKTVLTYFNSVFHVMEQSRRYEKSNWNDYANERQK